MKYDEFAQKLKTKYPQYKNIDDRELAEKMIAKYPQYKNQVAFEDQEIVEDVPENTKPALKGQVSHYEPNSPYPVKEKYLTPEYKQQIADIEKQRQDKINKAYIGTGVKIASPLVGLGLAPFTGGMSIPASMATIGGLEGLIYGAGDSLFKDKKGLDFVTNAGKEGVIGAGFGAGTAALFKAAPKILPKVFNRQLKTPQVIKDMGQLATNPKKYVANIKATNQRKSDIAELVDKRKDWGIAYSKQSGDAHGAIQKLVQEKQGFVPKAFYKEGIGDIDLVWGRQNPKNINDGFGLTHIIQKRQHNGVDVEKFLNDLPETIQNGIISTDPKKPTRRYIEDPKTKVSIELDWNGKERRWVLTAFKQNKSAAKRLEQDAPYKNLALPDGSSSTSKLRADENIIPNEITSFNPKGQSKLTQTLQDGKVANSKLKQELESANAEYDVLINKDTIKQAQEKVLKSNPAELAEVLKNNPQPNANEFTQARELIRRFQEEGNFEAATSLAESMATKASEAGQAVQALSLWGRLSPEGALRYANRVIAKANEKIKNPAKHIKMTPEQAEELTKLAKDIEKYPEGTRDRDIATAHLLKFTVELIPPKIGDQIKTLRNISLLLNPKTLGRNVIGNTLFNVTENASRVAANSIDDIASKFTGQKTRSMPNIKTQLEGIKQGAKEGFEDALMGIDTRGDIGKRFDMPTGRAFRSGTGNPLIEALNKLETGLDLGLRVPDRAQYTAVYNESIENMMRAQKLDKPTPEILDRAHQEALESVFQNDSTASKMSVGIRDGLNKVNVKDYGLGDIVAPYVQTPANLAQQGINYSPFGSIKSIINFNRGDQRQASMDLARSLVGSSIMGAGYFGAKSGSLIGEIGNKNSYEERANKALIGERPNNFYFNNKTGLGYEPFQPMSIPLSVGAALYTGENPISTSADTLLNLPFMQGVKNLVNDYNYGGVGGAVGGALASVPSQFVPTALSQVNQVFDNTARETYDPNEMKQGLNRALYKIPGLAQTLPIKYDVTGQPMQRYQNMSNNPLNVMLNPAYVNTRQHNPVISELARLGEVTGDKKQYLPLSPRKIHKEGKWEKLKPEQIAEHQRLSGQVNYEIINKLIQNNPDMSDYDKVAEIQKLQEDVKQAVDFKLFGKQPTKRKDRVNRIIETYLEKPN